MEDRIDRERCALSVRPAITAVGQISNLAKNGRLESCPTARSRRDAPQTTPMAVPCQTMACATEVVICKVLPSTAGDVPQRPKNAGAGRISRLSRPQMPVSHAKALRRKELFSTLDGIQGDSFAPWRLSGSPYCKKGACGSKPRPTSHFPPPKLPRRQLPDTRS